MNASERLIRYTAYPTASDGAGTERPSTGGQRVFAQALAAELQEIGMQDVTLRDGAVFASLPASAGCENAPALGFIAHMDVSPDAPDAPIRPRTVAYTGGDIVLNESYTLSPERFPVLNRLVGQTLIVTDGNTLLGADDKAGIAEIITACERLIADPAHRHPKLCIAFSPDEEIGRGADGFDVEKFGAKYAYTLDGSAFHAVSYENFNAAALTVTVTGRSVHPGSAKNKMINAAAVAAEYISMLPVAERPEHTEGRQGFYHVTSIRGTVESAQIQVILRDHDRRRLDDRKDYARRIAEILNQRLGTDAVATEIRDSYANMCEKIEPEFHLVDRAFEAIRALGAEPISAPIRGGTDGAVLSFMGLPCPNLGTGSYNHHGRLEFACVEEMEQCVRLVMALAERYADPV